MKHNPHIPRTSYSHPLTIDTIPVASGTLGLTLAPGKMCASAFGDVWARDLDRDIDAIKSWGASLVISLITQAEMQDMQIPDLGDKVRHAGMIWIYLGFPDCSAPSNNWWQSWRDASPKIHRAFERGEKVLVHCRGGLERTAMVAAAILVERGSDLSDALAIIAEARKGAGPLPVQHAALRNFYPDMSRRARQIRDCLLCGAIGDAMGAEIEFWSAKKIQARFPAGINELLTHQGITGAITDDTQMTLFTMEGLIRALRRAGNRGICHAPSVIHHALLRWLETQEETGTRDLCGVGLVSDPRLHVRRAPGITCLSALRNSRNFGDLARNGSKGCGAIMRTAPIAFSSVNDPYRLALDCAALTHGHPTGQHAAAAFTLLMMGVARGDSLEDAIRVYELLVNEETARALRLAREAPRDGLVQTVESLGQGWVAEEALSIAVYVALTAPDLESGLQMAVNHSGDSDSTGAIAGNLLGLMFPDQVTRHPFADLVECRDLIERLSRDLDAALQGTDLLPGNFDVRYPGS